MICLSVVQKGFSVILSDMCPLVSGITTRDAALSVELGMRALDLAVGGAVLPNLGDKLDGSTSDTDINGVLLAGGHLVIKLLESEDVQGWILFHKSNCIFSFSSLFISTFFFLVFSLAELSRICKPLFRKASWLRPKATRSSSREIYLICQGLQSHARM